MNHATGAVAPPDQEMVQVGHAIWQRAERRGLIQGSVRPVVVLEVFVLAQNGHQESLIPDQGPVQQFSAAVADPPLGAFRALVRYAPGAVARLAAVLDQIDLIDLDSRIRLLAQAVEPATVRSLDAIHLGTALRSRSGLTSFVTYDKRLRPRHIRPRRRCRWSAQWLPCRARRQLAHGCLSDPRSLRAWVAWVMV